MEGYQAAFNIAFTVAGGLGGFILKSIWDSLKDLRIADAELVTKVNSMEVLVAGNYIKREEFERLAEAIFAKLDRIEGKVDKKADR